MKAQIRAPIFRQLASGLAALLAIFAVQPALAQEEAISELVVDPPGRVARLAYVEGQVSLAAAGSEGWADAVLNRPLTSGDQLSLDRDARAELEIGSVTLHLDRGTAFGFDQLDDAVMLMSLTEGAASIHVRTLAEHERVQVETPNAAVLLREPGEYHFDVDTAADRTVVRTRSGEAEVRGGAKSYLVRANEEGVFSGLDDLHAQIGPIPPRTAFETWANDRAQREDESVSSRYVSRDMIGYEDLDDYGDWRHEPAYGYVWQPRYIGHWAPYRFGSWVWVSPWGWTWLDDARWGFAPFHYGRWVNLRDRWCWVPGPRHVRPVYAPAVVGWVGGSPRYVSDPFARGVGWFPLAPQDVYVPYYRYTPRYIRRVNQSVNVDKESMRAEIARDRHRTDRRRVNEDAVTRANGNSVTVVRQDEFSSGRPIRDQRLRVSDREMPVSRDNPRPAAIAPARGGTVAPAPAPAREVATAPDRTGTPAVEPRDDVPRTYRPTEAPAGAAYSQPRPQSSAAQQTSGREARQTPQTQQSRESAQSQQSSPQSRYGSTPGTATPRRGNESAAR